MTRDGSSPLLLVSQFFPPAVGGSAVLLANVYSRLGRHVRVLTDSDSSPGDEGAHGPFDVRHARLATPHWGLRHPGGLLHHARTARAIRRALPAPAASVHCARVLPEGVAAWLSRRTGGPRYVCWSHGEDLATASLSRELKLTTRLVLRGASASLANSRNTASLLRALGVPEEEIRVAHPGVDATRFHPGVDGSDVRRRMAGDADLVLLTVGRLQRRKGHDLVIRAVAELASELPRLRYLIVGTGEEEPALRELAGATGVADRVTFAGKVAEEDLPAWFAACDVFLLPNRREGEDIEGFGIVFLEAQATGRPVIAGSSGGAPEAIADGKTGFLVEGTDPSELAGVLRRLAASPELRAELGAEGRARVQREFTWERAAAVVAGLLADLERRR